MTYRDHAINLRHRGGTSLPDPSRVAMLSLHTSPLAQPGTGDAGGLNVYVWELSTRLSRLGVQVDIFTQAGEEPPGVLQVDERLYVHHLELATGSVLGKIDLPSQLCAFTNGVLTSGADRSQPGFDIVHSHYWLSGQVGWVASSQWHTPHVYSGHTWGRVKNRDLRMDDDPEPASRIAAESQILTSVDRVIANTDTERADIIELYGARPEAITVVHPGVDRDCFAPGDQQQARHRLGLDPHRDLVVFVGRLQPLKAPDVLIQAAAQLDSSADFQVVVCGGPSGNGAHEPERLEALTSSLGLTNRVQFWPPVSKATLADLYRAATLVAVPSHSESFGLVAAEAQACGTPVIAAKVGGLQTVVQDHRTGILLDTHDPGVWARQIDEIRLHPRWREQLAAAAADHAQVFGWETTTTATVHQYRTLLTQRQRHRLRQVHPAG